MTDKGAVVLFGATGGVGSLLARRLVARGIPVALGARSSEKLGPLDAELQGIARTVECGDLAAVEGLIAEAKERYGSISGVVNCMGSLLLKPAHLTSEAEFLEVLRVNLLSSFLILKASVRALDKGGSIVFVSSAAARIGLANHEAIGAAKAGIEGLARSAAATYAAKGIRVNCVAPGLVRTPLTARITGSTTGEKASLALHPLGRLGEPADICSAIEFLLDPDLSSWVTGEVLAVDGGLSSLKTRENG